MELVQVYKTMIRPVAEYESVVYHSSLEDEQDELLDNLQNHVLRCIFKSEKRLSGRRLRGMLGLETLRKSPHFCARRAVVLRDFLQRFLKFLSKEEKETL